MAFRVLLTHGDVAPAACSHREDLLVEVIAAHAYDLGLDVEGHEILWLAPHERLSWCRDCGVLLVVDRGPKGTR